MLLCFIKSIIFLFPIISKNQFQINGYECFTRDCNKDGGGLMLYISEGISCKVLTNHADSPNVEMTAIEFCQIKRKWLLLGIDRFLIQSDSEFNKEIIRTLNHYIPCYENILLLADLIMTIENLHVNYLMQIFDLNALIETPAYYRSYNPTCIDNILNQKPLCNHNDLSYQKH